MSKELLKNNNVQVAIAVFRGNHKKPNECELIVKFYLPKWKMMFYEGWELKDCIPVPVPEKYRYDVVYHSELVENSNEQYCLLFI